MKGILLVMILSLMFIVSPVFALGNLTINCTSLAPSFVNTNSSVSMLRVYLNVSGGDGTVNISSLNITLAGSVVYGNVTGNISAVQVTNATGSAICSNTTLNSSKVVISFTSGLFINASTNSSITILITPSTTASRFLKVSANINKSYDVGTTQEDNVTIGSSNISSESQIQDAHATASVSPKFADTNVTNQSFGYTITPTGSDTFNIINITLPTGYTITNVTEVRYGASVLYNSTYSSAAVTFLDKLVNVNYSIGFTTSGGIISINFTANTNSSQVASTPFASTVSGGNLTYVNTTTETVNATNVTTKQLFNVLGVTAIKTSAVVNGTDYWEFNLTLNFTENLNVTGGLIQFRMTNWSSAEGYNLPLTNQSELSNTTTYYASLRLSNDATKIFNISNVYNFTQGISIAPVANYLYSVVLKMIIPSATNVSSTWWSTYYTLFRSSP